MIRVRFAPSPTGYLHIGGVRTALFNFLYAKNQSGKFLLRIEDTDRERSKPEFEEEILTSLNWLGMKSDEKIIRQSERLEEYRNIAKTLIEKGLAYEETVDGKTAVKFKMPKQKAVFQDLVHGTVEFDTSLFDDLVIMKSDGYPTYHWACVIDDHFLEITHVIRGDDHLSNTPRQILLFEALGWKAPKYAHLPLILGQDGTPLSKRHGAVSLTNFKNEGYLPEGILNYLALLGWGTEGNQEFYSVDDLIKKFSIKRVNKANARFSWEKLDWLNAQHIKKLSESNYLERISKFYEKEMKASPQTKWKQIFLLFKSRIKTLKDLSVQAPYCFSEFVAYDAEPYSSFFENRVLRHYLRAWADRMDELSNFDSHQEIEKITREMSEGWGIEAKDMIHPLRFAVTGKTVSPGLFELFSALGKNVCAARIRKFVSGSAEVRNKK